MVVEEKRSPDLVREYFELLEWWNKGGVVLQDEILHNESLNSIRQKIAEGREWITSLEAAISQDKNELQDLAHKSNQLADQIFIHKQEIDNLERDKARIQVEASSSPTFPENPFHINAPELNSGQRLILLIQSFKEDLENVKFSLYRFFNSLIRSNAILGALYISFFSILISIFLVFLIQLGPTINILSYSLFILYLFYLHKKLRLIDRRHEQHWKLEASKKLAAEKQKFENEAKLRIEQKKQELDRRIYAERSKLQLIELDQSNLSVLYQQKTLTVNENFERTSSLEKSIEGWEQDYQERIEHLKSEKKSDKERRLRHLEFLAERWLALDVNSLTRRAMRKFKVRPSDEIYERYTLQYEPIRILVGRTEKITENLSIGISSENTQKDITNSEKVLIDPNDYKLRGISMNKKKRYGVYEFTIILLCENFLSYYKCYWNFVRKTRINDESCEYLYDSIVSVKVRERSSSRLKDETKNRVYEKNLILSTKDSRELRLRVTEDKIDRTHSLKLSQIDEAATAIRDMLRQRRIDVLFVKDIEKSQDRRDVLN